MHRTSHNSGERLCIEIRMTRKDTGFFDEIVTLKCNTASPVKVKIRASSVIEQKGACLKNLRNYNGKLPETP